MSILFEYDKTEVEEGYYILRISLQGSELIIAEYLSGSWYQPGADYDVWRWSGDPRPKIEIICGLDLDKIAAAADKPEAVGLKPFAWYTVDKHGCDYMSRDEHNLRNIAADVHGEVTPLYTRPAATDAALDKPEAGEAERLAKQIVQGVCELQEVPDPDHPDTIIVTVDDLEAVICNRLHAALRAGEEGK